MTPGMRLPTPTSWLPGPVRLAAAVMALMVGATGAAHAERTYIHEGQDRGEDTEEPWRESEVEFPEFPSEDALRLLELDALESRYNYYLVPGSMTQGEDKVVRYVIVIETRRGVRNVLFEGVRCATGDFKTYAYATRDGTFRAFRTGRWLPLRTNTRQGPLSYRLPLARDILCHADGGGVADLDHVMARLNRTDANSIGDGNPRIKDETY